MFGFSHIDFEWLSDIAMAVLQGTVWFLAVTAFAAALVAIWFSLTIVLGVQ
jgi:hypothetical protein